MEYQVAYAATEKAPMADPMMACCWAAGATLDLWRNWRADTNILGVGWSRKHN